MARPKGVTERCAAAARRRRASALCTRRNSAASHWCGNTSQALRASSPQGEPPLSGDAPSKTLLEGRSEGSALLHTGVCGNRSRFRMRLRGIRFSCGGKFLWLMQAGCILVTTASYGSIGREGAPGQAAKMVTFCNICRLFKRFTQKSLLKTSTFLLPFLEEHGMMEARERLSVMPGAGPRRRWCS